MLKLVIALMLSAGPAHAGALDFLKSADGFALCAAADVGSTIAAVENGAVELNPIWRHSVNEHNYAPLVLGNALMVGLVYRYRDDIPKPAFLLVNIVRCLAAGANMRFVF